MNYRIKLSLFLFVICSSLFAVDFGLSLNQGIGAYDNVFRYKGNLVPRVSGLIGENIDYYASAGAEVAYLDGVAFIPELLRTEFSFRSSAMAVMAGRMYHSDPMGLIASGLFDGARVSYDFSAGSLYAGAWYTGLLYKKRINIEMTAADSKLTNATLDYNDFVGTYFAPKHLIVGLGWEHLSLGGKLSAGAASLGWENSNFGGEASASAAIIGEFDLAATDALNSQYIIGKITVPFNAFSFSLGSGFQLIQRSGKSGTGFAAELGVGFVPPIPLDSKLSLLARFASGGDTFAFLPVTTVGQGNILGAKLSGITMIQVDYTAQLLDTLQAGISSSYFIRNDTKTYIGYPLPDGKNTKGNTLGNEFFVRLSWSPFYDIHANLGGGIFLPSMGNVYNTADSKWRVELNVILLLY